MTGTPLLVLLAVLLATPAVAQGKPGADKADTTATEASRAGTAAAREPQDPLAGRTRGSPRAPVTVYEMSDFQCPYCRRFALETFPALESAYVATGKVRWVFVNFPLTSIHQNALAAAEIAVCAAQQDAFWPVHDLLYRYQEVWAPLKEPGAFFLSLADSAKISRPALLACVRSPATEETVRAEAQGAERSGATSTPSFYIEGGLLAGAHPVAVFRGVLDSILKVKEKR
ncbi:MAG TPA: thioredoxin domain-containing protein [Gemmatimonadales bacterium]|nr:thioredoxin domain-containing protein [Gemmatimonadales bacterium]